MYVLILLLAYLFYKYNLISMIYIYIFYHIMKLHKSKMFYSFGRTIYLKCEECGIHYVIYRSDAELIPIQIKERVTVRLKNDWILEVRSITSKSEFRQFYKYEKFKGFVEQKVPKLYPILKGEQIYFRALGYIKINREVDNDVSTFNQARFKLIVSNKG